MSNNIFFADLPAIPEDNLDLGENKPVSVYWYSQKVFLHLIDQPIITWNIALGRNAKVTLSGSRQLVISNKRSGNAGTLIIRQDATGGRVLTFPNNSVMEEGLVSLSTSPNAVNILNFVYDGMTYYWSIDKVYVAPTTAAPTTTLPLTTL